MDRSGRGHQADVDIARAPEDLYALVSDVTQMGRWSPECVGATWDEGAGPRVGATFVGHNRSERIDAAGRRTTNSWDRRCRIVTADPGREFAWIVGYGDLGSDDEFTYWGFTFEPAPIGTTVTETWKVLKESPLIAALSDDAWEARVEFTIAGIGRTLARLKTYAEGLTASR